MLPPTAGPTDQLGLHEVYLGGLGSWSLTNMVLAHLLEESAAPPAPGSQPYGAAGKALLAFLQRFSGRGAFDYSRHAVSVRMGGCINRAALGLGFAQAGTFLVLEDPLTGALGAAWRPPQKAKPLVNGRVAEQGVVGAL